ncbi:MAG: hypothetical protein IPG92_04150 [Flavobacteriales bacterium]|nr:hypothetical protein [Flavobacteriales bacterium]
MNFGTTNTWDSQIALWSAPDCNALLTGGAVLVAANDDYVGTPPYPYDAAIAPVCVTAGATYYVQVDGYNTTTFDNFQLVLVEEATPNCDDGNACTVDSYNCSTGQCTNVFQDADADGVCDFNDTCPGTPNGEGVNVAGCSCSQVTIDDGNACTLDECTNGNVTHTLQDADGDLVCDANDNCPNVVGQIGSSCDDGNVGTINDILNASCQCEGVPSCTTNSVALTLQTDANGNQTSWEIRPIGGGAALCNGSGSPSNATVVEECCLPNGCYQLLVYDSFGDGMTTGGYVLRDGANNRIIDNANDGVFTFTSSLAAGFCVPTGTDVLAAGSCDQSGLYTNAVLYAAPNANVSAQYGVGNQTDDGYQFWFFDPDGGVRTHHLQEPREPRQPRIAQAVQRHVRASS